MSIELWALPARKLVGEGGDGRERVEGDRDGVCVRKISEAERRVGRFRSCEESNKKTGWI